MVINELLKQASLKDFYNYGIKENLVIDIKYDVMLATPDLLSIRFCGYTQGDAKMSSNNQIYAVNIELNNAEKIVLEDLF